MTVHHIFYIPTVFLLGLVCGALIADRKGSKITGNQGNIIDSAGTFKPTISGKQLLFILLIFVGIFIITHLFPIPYGAKMVQSQLGGLALFDKQPSFSGTEVYNRLQAYAFDGLAIYKRFTYTIDLLFPLSLFYFLFTLSRYVVERIAVAKFLTKAIIALHLIWLGFDLVENSIVFTLLSTFPNRNYFLAGILGFVTAIKFVLLFLSILAPPLLFLFKRNTRMS